MFGNGKKPVGEEKKKKDLYEERRVLAKKIASRIVTFVRNQYPGLSADQHEQMSWEKDRPAEMERQVVVTFKKKVVCAFHIHYGLKYEPKHLSDYEIATKIADGLDKIRQG